ncbi:Glycosyltransferase family 8 domain protein [Candidatus Hepatincolaceae symbiont of Richtersius coronifer]
MQIKEINIVFASNKYYLPHMATCIASIFINAASTSLIKIHILHSTIDVKEQNKILSLLSLSKNKLSTIEFMDLTNIKIDYEIGGYYSVETMYRLYIVKLFPILDRLIYLDCDTIVLTDLRKLLDEDMSNLYIAGTKDQILIHYAKENKIIKGQGGGIFDYYNSVLNFSHEDITKYIQAAVLVFNLKKIRQDHKENVMLEIQEKFPNLWWLDQDIINYAFKNQIKHLSGRWNFGGWLYEKAIRGEGKEQLLLTPKENAEFKDAMENPYIIHYAGHFKPNKHSRAFIRLYYKEYWIYRQYTPYRYHNLILKSVFLLNFFRKQRKSFKQYILNLFKKKLIKSA